MLAVRLKLKDAPPMALKAAEQGDVSSLPDSQRAPR